MDKASLFRAASSVNVRLNASPVWGQTRIPALGVVTTRPASRPKRDGLRIRPGFVGFSAIHAARIRRQTGTASVPPASGTVPFFQGELQNLLETFGDTLNTMA